MELSHYILLHPWNGRDHCEPLTPWGQPIIPTRVQTGATLIAPDWVRTLQAFAVEVFAGPNTVHSWQEPAWVAFRTSVADFFIRNIQMCRTCGAMRTRRQAGGLEEGLREYVRIRHDSGDPWAGPASDGSYAVGRGPASFEVVVEPIDWTFVR
jgi:hypothetical protein